MEDFRPLLDQAEKNIWAAIEGKPVTPIGVRSSIPVEPPTAKPQSPEEELASFQIMDGFAVNLFASEADGIVKPIQMRWDERGRLWVACAVSYPQIKPGEKANDYVLVCEDTDGDGKADKFHKFVEGLFMPAGLELGCMSLKAPSCCTSRTPTTMTKPTRSASCSAASAPRTRIR
jgi:hypothetical protein